MGVDKCLKKVRVIMICFKMFENIIKMVLECLVCLERMSFNFRELMIVYDILDILLNILFVYMD